jgi:putative membrane protein
MVANKTGGKEMSNENAFKKLAVVTGTSADIGYYLADERFGDWPQRSIRPVLGHPRLILVAAACIIANLASQSFAQTPGAMSQPERDKQFLEYVWQDNQAEAQLGINAQKMAQSPAVIAFARLVVSDNADLKNQVTTVLRDEHVQVAAEMVQQRANAIAPKTGVDFDEVFLTSQISHLRDDVARFQDVQAATNDDGIKKLAADASPFLAQELALAQAVQSSLQSGQARTGNAATPESSR